MIAGNTARLSQGAAFAIAACSLVLVFATAGAPIPLYNVYRTADGITNGDLGIVAVGYFVAAATSLLLLGRLSDHWGRRPVALTALGCATLSCIVLLHLHGVLSLFVGRLLQGLACGVASTALGAYVVDSAPARYRWLPALVTGSAPMVGISAGALACGVLVEHAPAPRQLVYVLLACALGLCALLLACSPETVSRKGGAVASLRPRLHVPRGSGRLLLATGAAIVGTWSLGSFYQAFGPVIVAEHLGTASPIVVACAFASVMVLNPVGGPLVRHWPATRALRLAMVVFVAAVAVIAASLHAGALVPFVAASLVVGVAQGAASTGGMRALLARAQPRERAGLLSLIYLVSYCAAAIPAMVAGALVRSVGLFPVTLGYAALAIVSAAVAIWAAGVAATQGK